MVFDIRKFLKIYRAKQVLALQLYSQINFGNSVPIRSLALLGGANSMRGYYDGRYRDRNQLVFQAEYRLNVYKRFGVVIFGNTGDVGHTPADYSFKDLKYSYGAGIRFALTKTEKLNLRADYGIGSGVNHGFYLQVGEAF